MPNHAWRHPIVEAWRRRAVMGWRHAPEMADKEPERFYFHGIRQVQIPAARSFPGTFVRNGVDHRAAARWQGLEFAASRPVEEIGRRSFEFTAMMDLS